MSGRSAVRTWVFVARPVVAVLPGRQGFDVERLHAGPGTFHVIEQRQPRQNIERDHPIRAYRTEVLVGHA